MPGMQAVGTNSGDIFDSLAFAHQYSIETVERHILDVDPLAQGDVPVVDKAPWVTLERRSHLHVGGVRQDFEQIVDLRYLDHGQPTHWAQRFTWTNGEPEDVDAEFQRANGQQVNSFGSSAEELSHGSLAVNRQNSELLNVLAKTFHDFIESLGWVYKCWTGLPETLFAKSDFVRIAEEDP